MNEGASDLRPPALRIVAMSKAFGPALALDAVSMDLERGEILGLLGHNGSGKSTLIKCLAGFHRPDGLEVVELNGVPTTADGVGTGSQIAFVHQDLGLVHGLTVVENFLLTDRRAMSGVSIPWKPLRISVAMALRRFELDFPLDMPVSELSQADRCLVAIVRAIETLGGRTEGQVLILDEPTPFLPAAGVGKLFAVMRGFASAGGSIIFVAHDIDEVLEITDRILVLRDGRRVAAFETQHTDRAAIVEAIVGRSLQHHHVRRGDIERIRSDASWRITGLSGGTVSDCDFSLLPGEILGVTGLIGSGASEIPELVTGARRARSGRLRGPGRTGTFDLDLARTPLAKLMEKGVVLLPDDRLRKSAVGGLSLGENIGLPALPRFSNVLRVRRRDLSAHVGEVVAASDVRPSRPDMPLQSYSGGNQQKVLIAKWLALQPKLLALSEPTQGVDVGSRQAIYAAIEEAAHSGTAVVCYSSDAVELAQICDRVLIFGSGSITATLQGDAIGRDAIVAASLGQQARLQAEVAG